MSTVGRRGTGKAGRGEDTAHGGARRRLRRSNGKCRGATPLWLGTRRWAIEGTKVGGRRTIKARAPGEYRIRRLAAKEWWAQRWAPWKEGSLRAHQVTGEARTCARTGYDDGGDTAPTYDQPAHDHGDLVTSYRAVANEHCEGGVKRGTPPASPAIAWPRDRTERRRKLHSRRRLVGYGKSKTVVAMVMAAMLAGCRIGEAANPGHGLLDPNIMKLRELTLPDGDEQRLRYANPAKQGFRGGKGPGFHKDDRVSDKRTQPQGEAQMKIESANVTGPAGLRTRLRATRADIFLAQETWATEEMVPELREWARKHKWSSIWAPAKPGTNGGRPSGGTAIFVRSHYGLREPDRGSPVWMEHRACVGIAEFPGYRPTICVAAYFQSGDK